MTCVGRLQSLSHRRMGCTRKSLNFDTCSLACAGNSYIWSAVRIIATLLTANARNRFLDLLFLAASIILKKKSSALVSLFTVHFSPFVHTRLAVARLGRPAWLELPPRPFFGFGLTSSSSSSSSSSAIEINCCQLAESEARQAQATSKTWST